MAFVTKCEPFSQDGDSLVVTVYARITGGGYRGAISVRRADDFDPLELACELPEIFAQPDQAQAAAADFANAARMTGALLRMLEGWEGVRLRQPSTDP